MKIGSRYRFFLRPLAPALRKDLLLLARDPVGLVFLAIAPVVVITVAGLSLASLYGGGERFRTGYTMPVVDEDRGDIGRAVVEALRKQSGLHVVVVDGREDARRLLRSRASAAALVVPAGASDAVRSGRASSLLLLTDPVKNVEVARVREHVQELRHAIEAAVRARAARALADWRTAAETALAEFTSKLDDSRRRLAELPRRLEAARADAERRIAAEADEERTRLGARLEATRAERVRRVRERLAHEAAAIHAFVAEADAKERAFREWLAAVREQAGKYADRMPSPPAPPAVPPSLRELADAGPDALLARLFADDDRVELPKPAAPRLPAPPALGDLPAIEPPRLPDSTTAALPGPIELSEESVTGAERTLNTFDQNVPGFSVTFLLLGMLFGVSLGLLDERDWGTLERIRATPAPLATILVAKLAARFTVGVAQMALLFATGRFLFAISLGPEPWALLLPITGITFAGTAFGLVVAAVARSREAVLPIGSIVILTMTASGGCWWPIDLEPEWMRTAALAFPTTWAMAAFNDLMIRRRTVEAVWQPTAALFAFGAAYLALGVALFRLRNATR